MSRRRSKRMKNIVLRRGEWRRLGRACSGTDLCVPPGERRILNRIYLARA